MTSLKVIQSPAHTNHITEMLSWSLFALPSSCMCKFYVNLIMLFGNVFIFLTLYAYIGDAMYSRLCLILQPFAPTDPSKHIFNRHNLPLTTDNIKRDNSWANVSQLVAMLTWITLDPCLNWLCFVWYVTWKLWPFLKAQPTLTPLSYTCRLVRLVCACTGDEGSIFLHSKLYLWTWHIRFRVNKERNRSSNKWGSNLAGGKFPLMHLKCFYW